MTEIRTLIPDDRNVTILYGRGDSYLNAALSGTTMYLMDVFVEPELRGNGVGTALFRAAKSVGERIGADRISADLTTQGALDIARTVFGPQSVRVLLEGDGSDPLQSVVAFLHYQRPGTTATVND